MNNEKNRNIHVMQAKTKKPPGLEAPEAVGQSISFY
jgi:hypothetical protein